MKNIVLLFAAFTALQTNAQLKPINYKDGSQKLIGQLATPSKKDKSAAGILILPAWKGIDMHAKETADKLAALGYTTFVADIYGEGNYPKNADEAGAKAGYYKSHVDEYRKRISLALDQLILAGADKNKIVVIGFCFGGTGAIEVARAGMNVKGVVSFHGGLANANAGKPESIATKVLVCHGADDNYVPATEVAAFQQEMRDAEADWQMISYGNSVHSFTDPYAGNDNSAGAAYNEKAANRSWEHFMDFLKEVLQ